MANLTLRDVMLIGGAATVGFTLLCYWYSGVMAKRNWSYQVKSKRKPTQDPNAPDKPGAVKP